MLSLACDTSPTGQRGSRRFPRWRVGLVSLRIRYRKPAPHRLVLAAWAFRSAWLHDSRFVHHGLANGAGSLVDESQLSEHALGRRTEVCWSAWPSLGRLAL